MPEYGNWELQVSDVKGKMDRGELIPDPEWQRGYIWSLKDEQYLIDSILNGMPIPKFYLTEQYDTKKAANIHHAIDGQQRLTAMHKFMSNRFAVVVPEAGEQYFKDMDLANQQKLTTYKLNGHFVRDYTQSDINFLFQRLNRTGVKLTNMEVWNNEYFGSKILKLVQDIRKEHMVYYEEAIYTEENIKRKLPEDDIVDLCHSLQKGGVEGGSKGDLQKFLGNFRDISEGDARDVRAKFRKIIKNLKEVLTSGDLQETQWGKRTHFISLFLTFAELLEENYLLGDPESLRESLQEFLENQPENYKEAVQGAIRQKAKRKARVDILIDYVSPFSVKLDPNRLFDQPLRQKLWGDGHTCQICKRVINRYQDAVVDHIEPWAKGGETITANGQLAHKGCNKQKSDKAAEFVLVK